MPPLSGDQVEAIHEASLKIQRATAIWQQALERHEQPPIDPAIREALEAHVAKREQVSKDVDH